MSTIVSVAPALTVMPVWVAGTDTLAILPSLMMLMPWVIVTGP